MNPPTRFARVAQVLLGSMALAALVPTAATAQQALSGLPEDSQAAEVRQRIGVTDMVVNYHRPGVKGRVVWGGLVPYGAVWRAGANENTVVSFSHAVKVEGRELAAGSYGLHMIPTATDWTIILSNNSTSWGSYFYKPEEDALRVTVRVAAAAHQEWLTYAFDNPDERSVVLSMSWEGVRVPIKIEVDTPTHTLASIRQQLRSLPGFGWRGRSDAAAWCVRAGVNLEEAGKWIDRSIAIQENPTNLAVKAGLLQKQGLTAESDALYDRVATIGSEVDANQLAYQMLGDGRKDKALSMFEKNAAKYPQSWNAHDSLGEALAGTGDKARAVEHYRRALELVTDPAQKERIAATLKTLESR